METKRCILCDHSFQAKEESNYGIVIDDSSKSEIRDNICLGSNSLCEWCDKKSPKEIIQKLKALGKMK